MDQLTPEMVRQLQGGKLVLLQTKDAETGSIHTSGLSWVLALDERTVWFAVDRKSKALSNLKSDPNVALNFFGMGDLFVIRGTGKLVSERMEGVTIQLASVDVQVEAVQSAMFYGGKITQEPLFTKTYNPQLAKKLDTEVYAAMKKFS